MYFASVGGAVLPRLWRLAAAWSKNVCRVFIPRGISVFRKLVNHLTIATAAACLISGCSLIKLGNTVSEITRSGQKGDAFSVVGYHVPPRKKRRFAAGAARIDHTPPPGFPTGGHGPAGEVARGYWMRLYSRAFFFEDPDGHALALISADLFAIPAGLPQRVATLATEKLAGEGIEVTLSPEAVIIAATHTHHGPGNFLTARIHNQFGSSWPGFDKDLFEFLAGRMAESVAMAVRNARDHIEPVDLTVHVHQVGYDLLRNRAPQTFLLNRNRDEILDELNGRSPQPVCLPLRGEPQDLWDVPDCPRLRAVDRTLTALEVARGGKRIAALVFFAAHPTALPASTSFYSPDFVGEAMASLEKKNSDLLAVGFFNGAEGDITLRRQKRDLRETIELGEKFAQEVKVALSAAAPPISIQDGIRVHSKAWFQPEDGRCGKAQLSPTPAFGTATLGGAEDDRTQLYVLGWRDGVRDSSSSSQGMKLPALDSRILRGARFTSAMAPPEAFPRSLPLTLAAIGDFEIATIPVEASTAQGVVLRHTLGKPHGKLELVGLANEYASYCASRDEYSEQDYMGASTIWGPDEGQFLACGLATLVNSPALDRTGGIPALEFLPGVTPQPAFGFAFVGETQRPDEGLAEVLRDSSGRPERHLPWFRWTEPDSPVFERGPNRTVAIWKKEAGVFGPLETDRGDGFLSIYLGKQWAAIWLRPLLLPPAGEFAFVVTFKGGRACSVAFPPVTADGEIGTGTCDSFSNGVKP